MRRLGSSPEVYVAYGKDGDIFHLMSDRDIDRRGPIEKKGPLLPSGARYDWQARKPEVLKRLATRAPTKLQPIGFIEAFGLENSNWAKAAIAEAELDYLIKTQEQDIAPLYLELKANGIDAISSALGEEAEAAEGDENALCSALSALDDGYRIEQWCRETDYAFMHQQPAYRARWFTKDGKRGLQPHASTPWPVGMLQTVLKRAIADGTAPTVAEIEALPESIAEAEGRREMYGPQWRLSLLSPREANLHLYDWQFNKVKQDQRWLDSLDPERLALLVDEQTEAYKQETDSTYDGSFPCPWPGCVDGIITVRYYDTLTDEECPACLGNGTVLMALGFSDDIWESPVFYGDEEGFTLED